MATTNDMERQPLNYGFVFAFLRVVCVAALCFAVKFLTDRALRFVVLRKKLIVYCCLCVVVVVVVVVLSEHQVF